MESTEGTCAVGWGAGEGSVGAGAEGAGCAGAAGEVVGSAGTGAEVEGAGLSGAAGAGTSCGCCGLQAPRAAANKMMQMRVFIALPQLTVTVTSKSPGVPWTVSQPF